MPVTWSGPDENGFVHVVDEHGRSIAQCGQGKNAQRIVAALKHVEGDSAPRDVAYRHIATAIAYLKDACAAALQGDWAKAHGSISSANQKEGQARDVMDAARLAEDRS